MQGFLAHLLVGAFLVSGCAGAAREEPELRVDQVLKDTPGPQDTSLRLVTTDVDGCIDADHEIVDVSVEETDTEVVIASGIKIGSGFICEIRDVREEFAVELDRPLGRRLVIDDSRGERSVIWSPQMRRNALQRLRVDAADAEAFIRSTYPAAENTDCHSSYGKATFTCILTASSFRKRVVVYVLVQAHGKLKALPELPRYRLPPELRTGSSP